MTSQALAPLTGLLQDPTRLPARPSSAILETFELTRHYGPLVALAPLDLRIEGGECVALMGPNGSGKTTAAALIAGLLEPSGGLAEVCGFSIHHEPDAVSARAHLAYVPDSPALYDDLTVRDHLELVAAAHGVADDDLDERSDRLLELLGMSEREVFFPGQLSRGMRQKTAIACALVRPFSLLILDEPVVGLDQRSVGVLQDIIREAVSGGRGVLIMTHSDVFAREVATRILQVEEGRVTEA
jgi:ABC-type multidrug transport system ATPase subunit